MRRRGRISFGSGDNDELERRIRTHAHFADYTPFTLLLLMMAELRSALCCGCMPLAWRGARRMTWAVSSA